MENNINTTEGHEVTLEYLKQEVYKALETVRDPEIPVDIRSLGLIYDVQITESREVVILMTLTAPNCPEAGGLPVEAEWKVKNIPGVKNAKVIITFDPPWDKSMMSEAAQLELGMF